MTVLIAFGKALLISLSILFGSCCLRYFYRFWAKRLGCQDKSDDLSESCKYDTELQSTQEMNQLTSRPSPAHDALSEIELPPSPGANTSCPPYNTNSLTPGYRRRCDNYSDTYSGTWRNNAASETTSADLTSYAGETTTVCSVLTGNDENFEPVESSPLPDIMHHSLPSADVKQHQLSCHLPEMKQQSFPLPEVTQQSADPSQTEFQDYQSYVGSTGDVGVGVGVGKGTHNYPAPPIPSPRHHNNHRQDRGTELFLSQYYKSMEQEQNDGCRSTPPPV